MGVDRRWRQHPLRGDGLGASYVGDGSAHGSGRSSERAGTDWINDSTALVDEYVDEYGSGSWSEAQVAQFNHAVENLAREHAPSVINEADDVGGVFILPWHRSISRASSSYADYCGYRPDHLRAIAADGAELYNEAVRVDIAATFLIAEDHVRSALPTFDFYDFDRRVEDMFDE